MPRTISRRDLLKAAGAVTAATVLAACKPEVVEVTRVVETEKVVTQVVKETVVVEGEEKVVTKVVEKVVTTEPAAEAPIQLTIANWFAGADVPPLPDSYIAQEVEKGFNVDIDLWSFERWSWAEQFNTRVAGGTVPDFWKGEGISTKEFVDQELLAEVPIEMIAENMPRTFAATLKYGDGSLDIWLGPQYKDVNYSTPWMTTTQTHPFCNGWRQDMLDKAGIGQLPETIEQHEAAFEATVSKGVCDYAMSPRLGDWVQGSFLPLFGAYNTFPHHWVPTADGAGLEWGGNTDGAKMAVARAAEWWKAGLINPESLTTKWPDLVNRWCQSKESYVDCGTWYRLVPGGELYDCVVAEGGSTSMAWAMKGPDGAFGYPGWGYIGLEGYYGVTLANQPEKMVRLMEMIDAMKGDPYWATLTTYGKQGVHYTRDLQMGVMRIPDEELTVDKETIGWGYGFGEAIPDIWYSWQGVDLAKNIEKAFAGNTKWNPNIGAFMDPDMCAEYTELRPIQDKWYTNFYSGASSMDEWDNYIEEFMSNGGECTLKNANEANAGVAAKLDAIRAKIMPLIS